MDQCYDVLVALSNFQCLGGSGGKGGEKKKKSPQPIKYFLVFRTFNPK